MEYIELFDSDGLPTGNRRAVVIRLDDLDKDYFEYDSCAQCGDEELPVPGDCGYECESCGQLLQTG